MMIDLTTSRLSATIPASRIWPVFGPNHSTISAQTLCDLVIHTLLLCLFLIGKLALLWLCCEHAGFGSLLLLALLFSEEFIGDRAGICTAQVHLRAGADTKSLVGSSKRHTIDAVRSGHKQGSAGQLLEEDHTSATEAPTKEDHNGARSQTLL